MEFGNGVKISEITSDVLLLKLRCVMPMLGQSVAEFCVSSKDKKVQMRFDISDFLASAGQSDDETTNPEKVKSIYAVNDPEQHKIATFWVNQSNEFNNSEHQLLNYGLAALMWVKEIQKCISHFATATEAELSPEETQFGNKKLKCVDESEELTYVYYCQDDVLQVICLKRASHMGLLAELPAFVLEGRAATSSDMIEVPEGVNWQDIPDQ